MIAETTRTSLEKKLRSATSPWDRLPILIELTKESHPENMDYGHQRAQEALTLARGINDRFWTAQSLRAVGVLLMGRGRYSEVLHYLQPAARTFKQLGDFPMKARTDINIAMTYIFMGKFKEAMSLLTQSILIFESIADQFWIGRSHRYIGYIYRALGEHGKGLEHYYQALAIATESDYKREMAYLFQDVALMYKELGDSKHHRAYLFKCLAAHRKLNNKEGIAVAMSNIANMYLEQERFLYAEKYVRGSGGLFRTLGFAAQEGFAWGQLGAIWNHKGDFARASRCYRKGILIVRKSENKLFLAKLYEYFGVACREAGHLRQARSYLKRALRILTESNHTAYLYDVHENLSALYKDLGDITRAFKHYEKHRLLKEEYINSSKVLEVGRVEMREQVQKLNDRLQKEQSRTASLKTILEKKEAELLSLALSLIKNEEEKPEKGRERRGRKSPLQAISSYGNRQNRLSGNWEMFARQFHQVHYDFYTGLIRRYPRLTPAEIKVCSLIRIGLSSKEMAEILCVSKGTIDKHRVRIHKKLELATGSSLSGFIAHM